MKFVKFSALLLLSVSLLAACGSGSDDQGAEKKTEPKKENKEKAKEPEAATSSFVDNTVTSDDAIVKYLSSEKGTDYDGKPILYTFFEITNKSDEPQNGQIIIMSHVEFSQNLGATTKKLEYGITMESPYQAKLDLLQQDINPEGTVEIAYTSVIEDETKPVTISFMENMFSKPVGTIDIE